MPRRKQRRAWGHIDEVVRGKKYVLRWTQNTPQGRRRPCETFYGTYREACARLDEIHVTCGDDRPVPTVGQALDMWYMPWLDRRLAEGKIKQSTYNLHVRLIKRHIRPTWGPTPVDSIKPLDIQRWLFAIKRQEAQSSLSIMRRLMDLVVQYEIVDVNKFRMPYEFNPETPRPGTGRLYDFAHARDVFDRIKGSSVEPSVILSLFGSARVGESMGVKRSEVSQAEAQGMRFALVPITRRVDRKLGLMPDGDLKTPDSARTLIIPEPYGTRLVELSRHAAMPGSEWLTPAPNGNTMTHDQLISEWKRAVGDAFIPFANLRNSWRTFAQYEWGVDYDTCELLMGHRLKGVTGKHYLKPSTEQMLERMAGELSALSQS